MIGTILKIPQGSVALSLISDRNLVYEETFVGTSQKAVDRFTYGRDLKLRDGKLIVDASGDLAVVEGVTGVINNVADRFKNRIGSLNPANPAWGMDKPANNGDVPFGIALDRQLTNMENQTTRDGRIIGATVDRSTVQVSGDRVDVDMEIFLIGGTTEKETFAVES